MKIALIQQSISPDIESNKRKLAERIDAAAGDGAELVVLQELHNTPYFCQVESTDNFDLAESVPGPSTEFYGAVARRNGVVLVTSLFERRAAGLYHNTAVVLERDGSVAGRYRKMHIPDDPAYYEKFYFTPGDLGFRPIRTSVGVLGVQVCWDQWYPEGARMMALQGAEVLIYPTAIGWESSDPDDEKQRQLGAWQTVQRGHAVANGLPVVAVNRCGLEPDPSGATGGIEFWGHSFVAGPQGEMLAEAGCDECVMTVDVDMAFPARPPYRRVRTPHPPIHRLIHSVAIIRVRISAQHLHAAVAAQHGDGGVGYAVEHRGLHGSVVDHVLEDNVVARPQLAVERPSAHVVAAQAAVAAQRRCPSRACARASSASDGKVSAPRTVGW